jgi:hypothetical protein
MQLSTPTASSRLTYAIAVSASPSAWSRLYIDDAGVGGASPRAIACIAASWCSSMKETLSTCSVSRAGATPLGAAQCVIASAKNRNARAPMRSASSRSSIRNVGHSATNSSLIWPGETTADSSRCARSSSKLRFISPIISGPPKPSTIGPTP